MSAQLVQMRVSQKRLVSHLKFSFSNQTTFLSELLQNGRRAKASRIVITQDVNVDELVIEDDGIGIEDFQKLIFIAESGWDQETIERESAYGLGVLSALFAAEHITVESRGLRLSAKTGNILDFQPVALEAIEKRPGTRITLRGLRVDTDDDVDRALRNLVKGFPIEVIWNGETLKRPHALNNGLSFRSTTVGDMFVLNLDGGRGGTEDVSLYLQGLPVFERHSFGLGRQNIVHLDPRQYFGRLPDRDKLIDEDVAIQQVKEVLRKEWRQRLKAARDRQSPVDFVDGHHQTMRYWDCLDLLNDLDILPRQAIEGVGVYPCQSTDGNGTISHMGTKHLSRQEIEQGKVKLFTIPEFEEGPAQLHMYAWLTEMHILDGLALHPEHWVHKYVLDLGIDDVSVVIPKPFAEGEFEGHWIYKADVVLCSWYEIDGPLGTVRNNKDAFVLDGFLSVGNRHVAFGANTVIVPEKEVSGDVTTQLTSFINGDDHWDENGENEEKEYFARFIRALKPGSAADIVRELLVDANLKSFPGMAGRQFTVKLNSRGKITVTEKQKKG